MKGLRASLVEQDRFLVTAACFLITTKYTSSHTRSDNLLEFYYSIRPLYLDDMSSQEQPRLSSPNVGNAVCVPPTERAKFLKEFALIKDFIAMEFFKLEFDIIS